MQFNQMTVLVTGANRGIGRALVQALAEADVHKIYATARTPASLAPVVALAPDRIVPLQLDVTDIPRTKALAVEASDTNVLINNAGALAAGKILDVSRTTLDHQLEVNLYGPLNMARAFAPVIEENGGGAIVNVLTLLSMVSAPGFSAYNISKAAAWSMHQSLRADLAERNIRVIGVFPGAIDTDMLAGVEMQKTDPAHVAQSITAGLAAGQEDLFPDPMSTQVYAAWKEDHKAVEQQFAAM